MSHGKFNKRGHSLYLENWNPAAQKYITVCSLCGRKGYDPAIGQEGIPSDAIHRAIYAELRKTYSALETDPLGRCPECARVQDSLTKK